MKKMNWDNMKYFLNKWESYQRINKDKSNKEILILIIAKIIYSTLKSTKKKKIISVTNTQYIYICIHIHTHTYIYIYICLLFCVWYNEGRVHML